MVYDIFIHIIHNGITIQSLCVAYFQIPMVQDLAVAAVGDLVEAVVVVAVVALEVISFPES